MLLIGVYENENFNDIYIYDGNIDVLFSCRR